MRIKVLTICILMLAACAVIICQSSLAPKLSDASGSVPKANPTVVRNEPFLGASVSAEVTRPAPTPGWETRFSEIVARGGPIETEDLEGLAATVSEDQIQDALDKLAADQSDPAMVLIGFLAQRWATNAPFDAAQWAADHLAESDLSHDVFSKIMVRWAEKDLTGAVAWVERLPMGGNKTAAILSLVAEAATQKEAETAINLAANLPPSPEREEVLNYSVQQWATTDRENAVAWVSHIGDLALREKILAKVAVNLGVQDPLAAAELVATTLSAGQDRDEATVDIIRFWTCSAPTEAAAWVELFPEGNLRSAAMENLVDVWGKENLSMAGDWLDRLPVSPSRDAAMKTYATLQAASSFNSGNYRDPAPH